MRSRRAVVKCAVLVLLVMGCMPLVEGGAQPTHWTLAPPWSLSNAQATYKRSESSVSKGHTATVSPTAGTGYLYLRMDTHTTNIRSRDGRAEGAFLLGGTFTPPATGSYEFTFVYEYSGEGKVEWRGSGYRFAAVAGVTAAVGDVKSVTLPLFGQASHGDMLEAALGALQGAGSIVAGAISGDAGKILTGTVDILKGYRSRTAKEPLRGTEEIVVVATLQGGVSYQFYVLTSGAVRAKASAGGNAAEANIKIEGKLREVRVRRVTGDPDRVIGPGPGPQIPITIIITPPAETPGRATTDTEGKFSAPLTIANARASGQLSICGQPGGPLANQLVSVSVLPAGATSADEVAGLVISVPGYQPRSATGMFVLTIGQITQFYLGSMCLDREVVVAPPPPVVTQEPEVDELAWSARTPLSWGDFGGVRPPDAADHPEGAEPALQLRYDTDYTLRYDVAAGRWKARVTAVTVENVLDRFSSWVDPARATDALLNHVQRHFDLSEVSRRVLETALAALEGVGDGREAAETDLDRTVDATWDAIWAVLSALQDQYDEETDHGRDVSAQALWDHLIDGWLADPSTAPLP